MARLTKKSTRNYLRKLARAINHYSKKSPDEIKICISLGNGKIGRVMNVSLAPGHTCGYCSHCLPFCYDLRDCRYPAVIDARARNTVLATQYRDEYFARIDRAMSRRRKNKYFRWHVGGEIPDGDYFHRMVLNARMHPDFIIWTYTKRHDIVNAFIDQYGRDAIPKNFTIMFSDWDGMATINPHNMPLFACKMKEGNVNHSPEWFSDLWKCPGNCDVCKKARRGCIVGETTYADEH